MPGRRCAGGANPSAHRLRRLRRDRTDLGRGAGVQGYVKPLIRELDVYDARQDREKNLFQQLYEAAAGGVSALLENFPRDEVATQADIGGPLDNPQASTWQVVVTLIQNAFFKAILPGFERELGRGDRGPSERSARPGAR